MTFGKRFSIHNDRAAPVVQRTCVRCCGTGRVRERGNRSSDLQSLRWAPGSKVEAASVNAERESHA